MRRSAWPGLIWGLALLGLFLLPTQYRAGAETAHAHSLAQLWVDAGDGSVHHHDFVPSHHESGPSHAGGAASWFDPAAGAGSVGEHREHGLASLDVGEQHDAAPAASGVHFLAGAMTTVVIAAASRAPIGFASRIPQSLYQRVLFPPPRRIAATA
ncbi:MAG: hypothetical protein M3Q50_09530 [Chloroflexota bacterium]|nr:hypothetical protein [Chloroflexota bacterium]